MVQWADGEEGGSVPPPHDCELVLCEDNCEQVEVLKDSEQVAGCGVRTTANLCCARTTARTTVEVLEDGEQ